MESTLDDAPTVNGVPLAGPFIGDIQATHRFISPRMFRSDFFEFFSKVHPGVPALMYLPLVAFVLWHGARVSSPGVLGGTFVGGFLIWTLTEYLLHRFYFHIDPRTPVRKWLYFYSHGIHHQYPDDFYRLVMPPLLSAIPAGLFWALVRATLPASVVPGLFAGFACGYVYYDYVHFATHHVKPPRAAWLAPIATVMKEQRRRHMRHHFQDHDRGFGVSMPLWDHVFGTHEGP